MTTTDTADGTSGLLPPKKPKVYQTEFADAHRACKTSAEREQLALIIKAQWTEGELHEFARLYHFRNGKDYPTGMSFRRAIEDLGRHYRGMAYPDAEPSDYPHEWLKHFRKGGSKPLSPRRKELLQRGRGLSQYRVSFEEYSWPGHTEEYRSMIELRCRDYFKIAPDQPVHVNAWAASKRAYGRECYAHREAERKATEAVTLVLSPKVLKNSKATKKSKAKAPRRKIVSSYDSGDVYDTLKPHFNYDFPGHTPAFLEEVAALARRDRGLSPDAPVSPRQWKITCNKRYCLIERPEA